MSHYNPFMDEMFPGMERHMSPLWNLFFQNLHTTISGSSTWSSVVTTGVTGTNATVDTIPVADGNAAFYLYFALGGSLTDLRAGMIMVGWTPVGTLPTNHAQRDIIDIGDCSDLRFNFTFDGTSILWRATSAAATYEIKAGRLLI